jgi:hypothetical protein
MVRSRLRSISATTVAIATALLVAKQPATAQEVIIAKESQRAESREGAAPARPAIVLRRRADHVVQAFVVSDDTRNAETRLGELKAALAVLDEAAKKSKDVRIALVAETPEGLQLVRPFDRDRAIAAIANGERPDTSQVHVLVKTAVVDGDGALTQPVERIEAFERSVKLAGRAQLEPLDEPALSLVKPEQYRGDVVAAIASDVHAVADRFGSGYGGKLEGLEHPILWEQLDELELGLYIPYRLTVTR